MVESFNDCCYGPIHERTEWHRGRGARPRVQERPPRGRRHRPRRSRRARSTASSGRTARASPRPCSCSRRCCRPPRARRAWPGYDVVHEGPAVRRAIGAALQEAALDPFLTGREHMRLQAALHGLAKAERERARRRAARARRADRGRRPQGGRLLGRDEAPPRPRRSRSSTARASCSSTSPPPASTRRAARALWEEVARLASDDGVTVFLTTQYLEEADVLADRVGIIDRGKIVAEGTPAQLKAEIGRPTVEAVPAEPADRDRLAGVLEPLRRAVGGVAEGRGRPLRRRRRRWPTSCARSTPRASASPTCAAPAHARRRVPGQDRPLARGRRRRRRRRRRGRDGAGGGVSTLAGRQVAVLARRSVLRTLRQPSQLFPFVVLSR